MYLSTIPEWNRDTLFKDHGFVGWPSSLGERPADWQFGRLGGLFLVWITTVFILRSGCFDPWDGKPVDFLKCGHVGQFCAKPLLLNADKVNRWSLQDIVSFYCIYSAA